MSLALIPGMFRALALILTLIGSQAFAADLKAEEGAFLQLVASRPYSEAAKDSDPLIDYWMTAVEANQRDLKSIQSRLAELDALLADPGTSYLDRAQTTLAFAKAGLRQLRLSAESERAFRPTARLKRERAMEKRFSPAALTLLNASQAVIDAPTIDNELKRLRAERALQVTIAEFNTVDLAREQAELEKVRTERAPLIERFAARLDEETQTGLGAPVYQLTVLERIALEGYTGSFYMAVNPALWTGKDLAQLQPFVDYISSALTHLPEYRGVVYRKIKMDDTQLAAHAVGQTVTYKGFTSTSVDDGFQSSSRNVDLKIHSLHGRFIAPYSVHFGENEVLFDVNSKFKVVAQRTRDDGKIEIELTEI